MSGRGALTKTGRAIPWSSTPDSCSPLRGTVLCAQTPTASFPSAPTRDSNRSPRPDPGGPATATVLLGPALPNTSCAARSTEARSSRVVDGPDITWDLRTPPEGCRYSGYLPECLPVSRAAWPGPRGEYGSRPAHARTVRSRPTVERTDGTRGRSDVGGVDLVVGCSRETLVRLERVCAHSGALCAHGGRPILLGDFGARGAAWKLLEGPAER